MITPKTKQNGLWLGTETSRSLISWALHRGCTYVSLRRLTVQGYFMWVQLIYPIATWFSNRPNQYTGKREVMVAYYCRIKNVVNDQSRDVIVGETPDEVVEKAVNHLNVQGVDGSGLRANILACVKRRG